MTSMAAPPKERRAAHTRTSDVHQASVMLKIRCEKVMQHEAACIQRGLPIQRDERLLMDLNDACDGLQKLDEALRAKAEQTTSAMDVDGLRKGYTNLRAAFWELLDITDRWAAKGERSSLNLLQTTLVQHSQILRPSNKKQGETMDEIFKDVLLVDRDVKTVYDRLYRLWDKAVSAKNRLQEECNGLRSKIPNLETSAKLVPALQTENQRLRRERNHAQEQHQTRQQTADAALSTALQDEQAKTERLTKELRNIRDDDESLKLLLAPCVGERSKMEQLGDENNRLTSELHTARSNNTNLAADLEAAEGQLQKRQHAVDAKAVKELNEACAENRSLRQKLEGMQAKATKLDEQMTGLTGLFREFNKQKPKVEKDVKDCRQQFKECKKLYETAIANTAGCETNLKAATTKLDKNAKDIKTLGAGQRKLATTIQTNGTAVKEKLETVAKTVKTITAERGRVRSSITDLDGKVDHWRREQIECRSLASQATKAQQAVLALSGEFKNLKAAVEATDDPLARLSEATMKLKASRQTSARLLSVKLHTQRHRDVALLAFQHSQANLAASRLTAARLLSVKQLVQQRRDVALITLHHSQANLAASRHTAARSLSVKKIVQQHRDVALIALQNSQAKLQHVTSERQRLEKSLRISRRTAARSRSVNRLLLQQRNDALVVQRQTRAKLVAKSTTLQYVASERLRLENALRNSCRTAARLLSVKQHVQHQRDVALVALRQTHANLTASSMSLQHVRAEKQQLITDVQNVRSENALYLTRLQQAAALEDFFTRMAVRLQDQRDSARTRLQVTGGAMDIFARGAIRLQDQRDDARVQLSNAQESAGESLRNVNETLEQEREVAKNVQQQLDTAKAKLNERDITIEQERAVSIATTAAAKDAVLKKSAKLRHKRSQLKIVKADCNRLRGNIDTALKVIKGEDSRVRFAVQAYSSIPIQTAPSFDNLSPVYEIWRLHNPRCDRIIPEFKDRQLPSAKFMAWLVSSTDNTKAAVDVQDAARILLVELSNGVLDLSLILANVELVAQNSSAALDGVRERYFWYATTHLVTHLDDSLRTLEFKADRELLKMAVLEMLSVLIQRGLRKYARGLLTHLRKVLDGVQSCLVVDALLQWVRLLCDNEAGSGCMSLGDVLECKATDRFSPEVYEAVGETEPAPDSRLFSSLVENRAIATDGCLLAEINRDEKTLNIFSCRNVDWSWDIEAREDDVGYAIKFLEPRAEVDVSSIFFPFGQYNSMWLLMWLNDCAKAEEEGGVAVGVQDEAVGAQG
ncbi:hypothetical protein LTR22_008703 [Elasticomyces elasticus]|nr:hypothetical protein LTR22_008703 [Elasticomyces elasticus]